MKIRTLGLGLVLAGLLGSAPSGPVCAEEARIAVVDGRRALIASNEGRAAEKALKRLMDEKKKAIEPEEAELKRLQEEFETQQYVLSPTAAQDRKLELIKRQRDLERRIREAQDDFELEQRKLMQPLLAEVEKIVRELGEQKGFALVLEKSSPGVLYTADALDITDLVIERLNERKKK
ncbi:MAG: OmpH family outer membrane protein [Myxococcota bacterium]